METVLEIRHAVSEWNAKHGKPSTKGNGGGKEKTESKQSTTKPDTNNDNTSDDTPSSPMVASAPDSIEIFGKININAIFLKWDNVANTLSCKLGHNWPGYGKIEAKEDWEGILQIGKTLIALAEYKISK